MAQADAILIPGEPDAPREYPIYPPLSAIRGQWQQQRLLFHLVDIYQEHVRQIAAWERGVRDETGSFRDELTEELARWRARVPEIRDLVMERLESHPGEVNDALLDHGSTGSVLYHAVLSNDAELVRLLLEKGAIPFLHEHPFWDGSAAGEELLFREKEGVAIKPEIIAMLREARSQYNVLEIMLQAQKHGVELRNGCPRRPVAQP